MRMPLPAVAPAMLLVALGFAPRTGRHDLRDEYRAKGGSTGGCSLQEAIYSANLHTNAAVDIVNADGAEHFTTTRCGTGNDTIIPPDRAISKMTNPLLLGETSWGDAVGVWKMSPGRSTFTADGLARSFTLRIERHPGGEVLTSDLKMPVRKVRISYEVHIT